MYCKTSQRRGVKFHFLTSMRPVPVASPSPSGFISRLPAYTLTVPLDTPPHYLENQKTWVSCIAGRFFTIWATREAPIYINSNLLSTESQLFLNYSGITASILRNFKMFEAWNSEIIKFKNIFKGPGSPPACLTPARPFAGLCAGAVPAGARKIKKKKKIFSRKKQGLSSS